MSSDRTFDDLRPELAGIVDAKEKIEHLLRERQEFFRSDTEKMLDLCEELRSDAESQRQQSAAALATIGIARALKRLGRPDDAVGAFEAALAHLESVGDDYWCGFARKSLGSIALGQGRFAEARTELDRALRHYRGIDHRTGVADVQHALAELYGRCGDLERATSYGLEALEIVVASGDRHGEASILLLLGRIHAMLEDDERVEGYLLRTIALGEEIEDSDILARASHNLGEFYLESDDPSRAEEPLVRARGIFESDGFPLGIARSIGSLGRLREVQERYDEAVDLYEQAIAVLDRIEDRSTTAILSANLGSALLQQEKFAEALAILDDAQAFAAEVGLRPLEQAIEADRSQAAAGLGDYERAWRHGRRSEELLADVLAESRTRAVEQMQIRFDVERAMHEKEIFRLRNEQLEMMIEERTKELAAMALHLVEKAEMLETFGKQVRKIAGAARDDARKLAESLLTDLDRNDLGEEWERFEQQLDATQGGFVRRLGEAFPELTSTELRIASLLKIGLATREIAGLVNLSERSIESHRYHIRKKVGLESSRTLLSFLRGFEEEHATRRAVAEDRSLGRILRTDFPDLSDTERKVCVLTRNGLKTKEIAEFLGVAVRTVETHRYNVRKKLGLEKGENLRRFLDRLG